MGRAVCPSRLEQEPENLLPGTYAAKPYGGHIEATETCGNWSCVLFLQSDFNLA